MRNGERTEVILLSPMISLNRDVLDAAVAAVAALNANRIAIDILTTTALFRAGCLSIC